MAILDNSSKSLSMLAKVSKMVHARSPSLYAGKVVVSNRNDDRCLQYIFFFKNKLFHFIFLKKFEKFSLSNSKITDDEIDRL